MREIKFRGKCSQSKRWVYGAFVPDALEQTHSDMVSWGFIRRYNGSKSEMIEVDRKTVGEYTGLKDKNGKEIYEGDIIKYKTIYKWDKNPIKLKPVVFENGMFTPQGVIKYLGNNIEVIGNLHDSPDLLEVTE